MLFITTRHRGATKFEKQSSCHTVPLALVLNNRYNRQRDGEVCSRGADFVALEVEGWMSYWLKSKYWQHCIYNWRVKIRAQRTYFLWRVRFTIADITENIWRKNWQIYGNLYHWLHEAKYPFYNFVSKHEVWNYKVTCFKNHDSSVLIDNELIQNLIHVSRFGDNVIR